MFWYLFLAVLQGAAAGAKWTSYESKVKASLFGFSAMAKIEKFIDTTYCFKIKTILTRCSVTVLNWRAFSLMSINNS
jgi:hypothetical protein